MRYVGRSLNATKKAASVCSAKYGTPYDKVNALYNRKINQTCDGVEQMTTLEKVGMFGSIAISWFYGIFAFGATVYAHGQRLVCMAVIPAVRKSIEALKLINIGCEGGRRVFSYLANKTKEQADNFVKEVVDPFVDQFEFDIIQKLNKTLDENVKDSYKSTGNNITEYYSKKIEQLGKLSFGLQFIFPVSILMVVFSAFLYHRSFLRKK
jgi:hypothetical protein